MTTMETTAAGKGGRDRLAGADAEIGVRRSQHDGHEQAEEKCPERELAGAAGSVRHDAS